MPDERPTLPAVVRRKVITKLHQATHLGEAKPAKLLGTKYYNKFGVPFSVV